MKICDLYSHRKGLEKVKQYPDEWKEIRSAINSSELAFGLNAPKDIKRKVSDRLNQKGWADKVRVGNSKLTISFLKSRIGVCFQIGNVARTYADILKLSQLHKKGVIEAGVIIVPHKIESKKMGANYAQYHRLSNELAHFIDIVKAPILVVGLSN